MSTRSPSTARLAVHAVVLWLVMLALMPLVAVDRAPLISDEGALMMQVETLERYGRWDAPYPLHDLDPEGNWIALGYAFHQGDRIVPYTARPVYIYLNVGAHRVAGIWSISALGSAAAALTALTCGLLARELDGRAALIGLWLVGLGTPVLFHSYVLHGHTLGTLAAALACLAAVRALRSTRPWSLHVAAGVTLLVGCLIRRELAAMALGLAVWGVVHAFRIRRIEPLGLSVMCGFGATAGVLMDRMLLAQISGEFRPPHVPSVTAGANMTDQVQAAYDSLLLTTFVAPTLADLAALIGLVAAVVGAARWRRMNDHTMLILGLGLTVAGAAVKLVAPSDTAQLVPGLLVVAPVLVVGVMLLPAPRWRSTEGQCLAVTAGVTLLGVMATQHPLGWGWGGRFLLVAVPPIAALSAVGWTALFGASAPTAVSRTRLVATASVLALAVLALASQRDGRLAAEHLRDTIVEAAGDDTVVATTELWLPRYDTEQLDAGGQRWAWARGDELDLLLADLARGGVTRVIVPAFDGRDIEELSTGTGWRPTGPPQPLPQLRVPITMWELER